MKQVYLNALNELISLVETSRDAMIKNHENYEESVGSIIFLGDKRFGKYASMVETNEIRASKTVESLAVELFSEAYNSEFELYPIDSAFKLMPQREQAKLRPFQIVLSENNVRYGIVFCSLLDTGDYYKKFVDGKYAEVDALRLVVIADPNDYAREALFTSVNSYNKSLRVAIERIPILDFWKQYFGEEECYELKSFCEAFNDKAREIIGMNTVISPTEKALQQFREKCGKTIVEKDYTSGIPESVWPEQTRKMMHNYYDRGLWRAMIGRENFAVSFITSEWLYNMYQLTENLDLTNVVAGYLKSIEQLLFAIFKLSEGNGITIQSKGRKIVQLSKDTEDIVNSTLGALNKVVEHNSKILDVAGVAKDYLVKTIDDWRSKQRNGYFHQDNLHCAEKVEEIREKAFQLYFLILGSCKIKDEQMSLLGIES